MATEHINAVYAQVNKSPGSPTTLGVPPPVKRRSCSIKAKSKSMSFKTYSDAFWGGDLSSCVGFETLKKRNQDGKKLCQEVEEYLKKRARLEADYSKSLSNLAKCFSEREEIGVLEATIHKIKAELDTMASAHTVASTVFQNHADTVKKFREDQTANRKSLEDTLHKAQSSKLSQLSKTKQVEKVYVSKSVERDHADDLMKKVLVTQNAQTTQKEIDKARTRAAKTEEDAQKAQAAYKGAVMVLGESKDQWEREMLTFCQTIQELDEQRLTFLREELWSSLNTDSQLCLDIDHSCDSVREILEKCDIVSDIQAYIVLASTGEKHPDPYLYKDYKDILNGRTEHEGFTDYTADGADPYCTLDDVTADSDTGNGTLRIKNVFGLGKKKTSAS